MTKGSSNRSWHFPKSQLLSFSLIAFLSCKSAVATEPSIPNVKLVKAVGSSEALSGDWVQRPSMWEGLEATNPGLSPAVAKSNANIRQNQRPQNLRFKRLQSSRRPQSGSDYIQPAEVQKPRASSSPSTSSVQWNSAVNTKHSNQNTFFPSYHASPALLAGLNPHAPQYYEQWVPNYFQSAVLSHPSSYPPNQVETNIILPPQAVFAPTISTGQCSYPPMLAQTQNGEFWWNPQSGSWDPVPIPVELRTSQGGEYDPDEPDPVLDERKLWEDIDHDIVDLVHNEGFRLPGDHELTKQDDFLPQNQKPLQEVYPFFYNSHSSSTPEFSGKMHAHDRLLNKPDSKPEQGGVKEKKLTDIKVALQPSNLKTGPHEDSDSSDDWEIYKAAIHSVNHNDEIYLTPDGLQPIKRHNDLFQSDLRGLTSTPASHPNAWPSLSRSDLKGPEMEAHRPVYSQVTAT